jgi:low molecular weight protein-tyrosine phosphatase
MAHAIFADLVKKSGLENRISVDSCGTGGWHAGEPAHPGTARVLEKHGIRHAHSARQITKADLTADYLIAMDRQNLRGIQSIGETTGEHGLLLEYAPELQQSEVPDPYYDGRFDEVYTLVETGCKALLDHIREKEGL